jgi:hypothetical protein
MAAVVADKPVKSRPPRGARRFGYSVAIAVNVALIVLVVNLVEWELASFLTDDFSRVEGLIVFSLAASVVANAAYLAYDPRWFRAIAQAGLNLISLIVMIRVLQVFPFEFATYDVDWGVLIRIGLWIGIIGSFAGTVAEIVRFARLLATAPEA